MEESEWYINCTYKTNLIETKFFLNKPLIFLYEVLHIKPMIY